MTDESKDTVTESEKKILRGLPYVGLFPDDPKIYPDTKKVLNYLGKYVFNKSNQLKHHSLAFKVAIVEVLNDCANGLSRDIRDPIFNKMADEAGYLKWDRKDSQYMKKYTILSDTVDKKYKIALAKDQRPGLIGNYGNKMFAAISSNEIAPTQELQALKNNPNIALLIDEHIQKVAATMTPDNCEKKLDFCIRSIAKIYGIPVPKIKVVNPGEDGFDGNAGGDAWSNRVRLNKANIFNKDGKFIIGKADWLKSALVHELMHLKDDQNIEDYKQSLGYKALPIQEILDGKPGTHQAQICRLLIATNSIENYTHSENLANGRKLHDNNPLERRAMLTEQGYDHAVSDAKQKNYQHLVNKKILDATNFVDAYVVTQQHNNKIDTNADSYKRLDEKHKEMLREVVGASTEGRQVSLDKYYPENIILGKYYMGIFEFLKGKEVKLEYIIPSDQSNLEEWHKRFSASERVNWEKKIRKAGVDAVINPMNKWDKEEMNSLRNDILRSIQNEEKRHGPSEKAAPVTPKEDKSKPPLVTAIAEPQVRAVNLAEAREELGKDSKRVALQAGAPIKPLKGAVNYADDSFLKGRVAKSKERTLTALPVPELAAAAHTQKHSPRAPGLS